MPHSMTGFARTESKHSWGTLTWELRSVNHRYLEMQFRLPEEFREIEPKLREANRKYLQRGKIEASLYIQFEQQEQANIGLDEERIRQISQACSQISKQVANCNTVNPLDILRWPGVQTTQEHDRDTLHDAALELFHQALGLIAEHREREGTELAKFIEQRLTAIAEQVAMIRDLLPTILQQQREKMQAKIAALQVELEPERLEQEIVLMSQKADVDEELDRLDAHIIEVRLALGQNKPSGRRLDFLMQELNREANTLSSKSVVSETTQAAVELKVLIEQMREQIQNIE